MCKYPGILLVIKFYLRNRGFNMVLTAGCMCSHYSEPTVMLHGAIHIKHVGNHNHSWLHCDVDNARLYYV